MNLDESLNLQSEIFNRVFGFQEMPAMASAGDRKPPAFVAVEGTSAHLNITQGRKRKQRDARDLIALGTLPAEGGNRNPEDLKIGVFVQRQDLRQHPLVEKIQEIARGEARIIYTGKVIRRACNPGRSRPLLIGGSIGHHRVTAGSIGCFCSHRGGGGIGILSNNHVLADTNKAVLGDVIQQPGRVDGGRRETDRVATLFSFVPIAFDTGSRNLVDCAFATLLGGIDYCPHTIHDHASGMSWPLKSGAEDLLVRDKVRKVGRTTGHSDGAVVAIEVNNLTVAMILGNGERLARFDRQIAIESEGRAFSASGDSGSLIISQDNAPAALLFAGTETGGSRGKGVTFANPIQTVFDALSIDLHLGS